MSKTVPFHSFAIAIYALIFFAPVTALAQADPVGGSVPGLNPLSSLNAGAFPSFRDRPLFSNTRRAVDAPHVAPETAGRGLAELKIRLIGVLQTPDGAVARIVDLDSGTKRPLRIGDVLRDWSVVSITDASMSLKRDNEIKAFNVFRTVPPLSSFPVPTLAPAAVPSPPVAPSSVAATPPNNSVRVIKMTGRDTGQQPTEIPPSQSGEKQEVMDVFGTGPRSGTP